MTISALLGRGFVSNPFVAGLTGEGARFAGTTGFFTVGGCAAVHSAEPYLLSSVCHCPSASTMTSSTPSGVCFKISSKYLEIRAMSANVR